MTLHYVNPSRPLDPILERLVCKQIQPGELVWQWTGNENDNLLSVLLIDEEIHREHKPVSEVMGGLCAGSGRSLTFKQVDAEWEFVEEGQWIS